MQNQSKNAIRKATPQSPTKTKATKKLSKNSYSGKQAPKVSIVGIQKANRNGLTSAVTGLQQQLQQVTGIEIKG